MTNTQGAGEGMGGGEELLGQISALLAMHDTGNLVPRVPNIPIQLLRDVERILPALKSQRDDLYEALKAIAALRLRHERADDREPDMSPATLDNVIKRARAALSASEGK